MPNEAVFPKIQLPDLSGVMAAGPKAVLGEIRRSLNATAASVEASLPGLPAPAAVPTITSPKEFIRGLEVQVEKATGITMPRVSDIFPGPAAPEEVEVGVGRPGAPAAARRAPPLVFE